MTTSLLAEDEDGFEVGRDPKAVPRRALEDAGHIKRPMLRVIREKCIDCSGGDRSEADKCTATACFLWPYRRGTDPFTARRGNPASLRPNLRTSSS